MSSGSVVAEQIVRALRRCPEDAFMLRLDRDGNLWDKPVIGLRRWILLFFETLAARRAAIQEAGLSGDRNDDLAAAAASPGHDRYAPAVGEESPKPIHVIVTY
jgi:hypothetical protein